MSFGRVVLLASALATFSPACARPPAVLRSPVACAPGTFSIAGACLGPDEAGAYCGKSARPEAGGCVLSSCEANEPIDLATGDCVPNLELRKMAAVQHLELKDDVTLGCTNPETTLVTEQSRYACVPRETSCGRGSRWRAGGCKPDQTCPAGLVADMTSPEGTCVPVVKKDRGDAVLDVGSWLRLVIGPDGGEGTPAVCGPLGMRPWAQGVAPHGRADLDVRVRLVFPDNDVTLAEAHVLAKKRGDSGERSAASVGGVTDEISPLWKALRAVGGVSNAASATVTVHCRVESAGAAAAVPRDVGRDVGKEGIHDGGVSAQDAQSAPARGKPGHPKS